MKKLGFINELNTSIEVIKKLPIHKKARGVVFLDEDSIICVEEESHNIKNLLGLPGGTVDDDENEIEALKREVKEETGYEIENIVFKGIVEVVRKKYLSVTYCYTAKTIGTQKKTALSNEEMVVNTKPLKINFKKAFDRINEEYNKNPNDNSLRSILIMKAIE